MGQGMCAGIRDASNLAWKINHCIKRGHNEKLLNSFQSERFSNVKEYIQTTMKMGEFINAMRSYKIADTVSDQPDGSKSMKSIKPELGKGLGLKSNKHRGKTFPKFNIKKYKSFDDIFSTEKMIIPYASDKLDFEGEMALIMKESGSHIKEEDALNHIAGYSCYNDGSVRDWQRHTKSTFGMGKNFKKTGSFGPHMVLAEDIEDYKKLTLETVLNGEVMQSASLSQLIFDLPFLISYVSKALPWRAGDVLVTGTPGGVGFKRNPPIFLREGDKVDVKISEIGTLSNTLQNEVL